MQNPNQNKLNILRKIGLFGEIIPDCIIYKATEIDDLNQAYKLVHDTYVESGYIKPDPTGMRIRIFEKSNKINTFVAKINGEIIGVLSLLEDSEIGLPSDLAFKKELDELRKTDKLCELTNQVIAGPFRKGSIATELMRCAVAHALKNNYTEGVASISSSHRGFYELMGFRLIGEKRSYSNEIYDPVIAVSLKSSDIVESKIGEFMYSYFIKENKYLNN